MPDLPVWQRFFPICRQLCDSWHDVFQLTVRQRFFPICRQRLPMLLTSYYKILLLCETNPVVLRKKRGWRTIS